jgi:glutathione S-transferase
MFTLYSMQRSGNSYKVRLAMAQLAEPYRLVEVDILQGESRTPEFLAKNPNGQIPLLEISPGRYLAESNAILWYVGGRSRFAPEDRLERAETMQWMYFEQHAIAANLGQAYFWQVLVKGGRELQEHNLEEWMEAGHRSLRIMERHLSDHDYFVANRYTIADMALYAYTHIAPDADFDLAPYPAVQRWLGRIAREPGHIRFDWQPQAEPSPLAVAAE